MTRRGSLVYYLASWICGGLFLTVACICRSGLRPGNGNRSHRGGRRDHHDVFSGSGFLRVSVGIVCVSAAAFHALAARGEPLAVGAGRDRSLCAIDLGSALGVARHRRRGVARRGPPGRCSTFSRCARHRRKSPIAWLACGCNQRRSSIPNSPSFSQRRIVKSFLVAQASACGGWSERGRACSN